MDIDDGPHHPYHRNSIGMDSPDPSGEQAPLNFHPQSHGLPGSSLHHLPSHPPSDGDRLSASDDSHQLMTLPSPSSPTNHTGEMWDGLHSDTLSNLNPFIQDVIPRKRKRAHDLPHTHTMDYDHIPHDDTFIDGSNSQSRRRTRPRLQTQRDREFTPLLIMSPGQGRDLPDEETITAFHYPPDTTNASHSIRRYFHFENPSEYDTRMLQSSSSLEIDPQERERSDSTSSFAEVALATTTTSKQSRLSTLQGFSLPRPFEETKQPSSDNVKVHERGLDALPSFFSTSGGRMGSLRASRAEPTGLPTDTLGHPIRPHALSPRPAMLPLDLSTTSFFDKPICDSPESMDSDEAGRTHFELPRPTR